MIAVRALMQSALATSGQQGVIRQQCAHAPLLAGRPQSGCIPSSRWHQAHTRRRATLAPPINAVSSSRAVDLSGWSAPGPRSTGGAAQSTSLDFQLIGSSVSGARGQPRGVVHFLGGAFAGATPQLTYSALIRLLAEAGYTVISTPYAVTFKHTDCAAAVQKQFVTTLAKLRASERGYLAPEGLAVHGVGHSNGALLHLLIGSLFSPQNASNVIISFNNKCGRAPAVPTLLPPVTAYDDHRREVLMAATGKPYTQSKVKDAIPVPLDPLRDFVSAVRGSMGTSTPTSVEMLRVLAASVLPPGQRLDEQLLVDVAPLLDQLGSVFSEVGDGFVEFEPSPSENRRLVRGQYVVPATLLVKFLDDSIDESEEMAQLLRQVQPRGTEQVTLPGTHVTPCSGDIGLQWQPGQSLSPTDVLALGVRTFAQADVRRLADRLIGWLNFQSAGVSMVGPQDKEDLLDIL